MLFVKTSKYKNKDVVNIKIIVDSKIKNDNIKHILLNDPTIFNLFKLYITNVIFRKYNVNNLIINKLLTNNDILKKYILTQIINRLQSKDMNVELIKLVNNMFRLNYFL